ncbi:stearoyl-CoA 9-desaturase, partial [Basidiobolus ranarum]
MAAKVESIPWEKRPLWDRLHKIHCVLLISTPLIALYGFTNTPMPTKTLLWTLFYYYISAFGITGGYHRLW